MVIRTMTYLETHHKYHQIHIDLTKQLYDLTGESIFNEYSELWKNHNSPPLL